MLAKIANARHPMAQVLKIMQPQALVAWSCIVPTDGRPPSSPEKTCRYVLKSSINHSISNMVVELIFDIISAMLKEQTVLILGLSWIVARRRVLQVLIAGIKSL